jgi:HEAT repeat protein
MKSLAFTSKIDSLLSDLDQAEPVSFDLGTPELPDLDAVHQLVAMGTEIVPHLLERLQGDGPKQRTAYIVQVLNQLGDVRALAALLDLRARYQQRETKDEWDYAVIGQCNLAIEQLQKQAR